jgi:Ca-activated chloride channel family protein
MVASFRAVVAVSAVLGAVAVAPAGRSAVRASGQDGFQFKSATDLVNITATVSDATGRFVPGLRKEDFQVYEDDKLQSVSHFGAERVPVSLGIAIDTSESMAGEKMRAAREALNRFCDLLDANDEIFLYRFSDQPVLVQGWTGDRRLLSRAIGRLTPGGATAMYDAVAEALPLAESGRHQKKALVVISDGNDNSSHVPATELKRMIERSEVLVYAIGVDGDTDPDLFRRVPPRTRPRPMPMPFPFPRNRGRGWPLSQLQRPQGGFPGTQLPGGQRIGGDRVNPWALRELTDASGGRTEIVDEVKDLDRATVGIADELSQQYYLGYLAPEERDGRWHSIRVEVSSGAYRVRARSGYFAD